ncbi:MAG: DNA (cytosine-5-)-methyltransferase [Candidatus Thorarchaeota archaeon]|nr:DNA (cytosine-5-)-methyltransferase [Candidatus Thorarchaeota archaeon]
MKSSESLLFNHVSPSLSRLDLEIIRSIPPGGNWQNIPLETAKKSSRIMQIRASGGRTTYYGRLRPDMPSYTVNTYFHRPGNGSFIHYSQDRMISLREAARLQSFPDAFVFQGSLSSICKQIGNAVPPLLARAVGLTLKTGLTVDLFAGSGGLSHGLKDAGHDVIVAAEINPAMCETYALNHPTTQILQVDLSNHKDYSLMVETVENTLHGRSLSLLAGGPPCQGFSTAGHWNRLDSRNDLVSVMLQAVADLRPEQVLIENVLGIKWMAKGVFLKHILATLANLGYSTHYSVLRAEQFGVPQRRRRVVIIADRDGDLNEFPSPLFQAVPKGMRRLETLPASDLPPPISVEEAIGDLPPVTPGGGEHTISYNSLWRVSNYQQLMRGELSFEKFYASKI